MNNLNSLSGWPDVTANVFTSDRGLYNEEWSQVDGSTRIFESFSLDATFRNTRGDPILYMFYIWLHYMSNVFDGTLIPYIDFITENEIDYNTRIYRLVLDKNKKYVTKIAATGASLPMSIPTASFFDFNKDTPFNLQNKDFTVRFHCNGADYMDDISIKEFNDTVVIFAPFMSDKYRESVMVKVDDYLLQVFNNRGYPRIDPKTYEMEWWVAAEYYNRRTQIFLNSNLAGPQSNLLFEGD
jgi:hypothetical protein